MNQSLGQFQGSTRKNTAAGTATQAPRFGLAKEQLLPLLGALEPCRLRRFMHRLPPGRLRLDVCVVSRLSKRRSREMPGPRRSFSATPGRSDRRGTCRFVAELPVAKASSAGGASQGCHRGCILGLSKQLPEIHGSGCLHRQFHRTLCFDQGDRLDAKPHINKRGRRSGSASLKRTQMTALEGWKAADVQRRLACRGTSSFSLIPSSPSEALRSGSFRSTVG